ncbi:MAG: hypothetical protein M0P20_05170, partial [Methanocorpusculum sp.]|nr:hypothetical protein [Methanocorpusculum sp.]
MMVGFIVIISFVGVIALVSTKSAKIVQDSAFELAENIAEQNGYKVKTEIDVAMDTARTMAQTFEGIVEGSSPDREAVIVILKKIIEENPAFLGVWTGWEPNAFDGKDRMYINTAGHDETGRFIPYLKVGAEHVSLEALKDYEIAGVGDYYQIAKNTRKEAILDPFYYNVAGESILMTTVAVPVFVNEDVAGVVGVDMALDSLQKIVSEIKLFETGYGSLISNKGLVVAHNDNGVLGKKTKDGDIDKIKNILKVQE